MANPQHVKWLKEGVEAWNKRREEEPFEPDLLTVKLEDEDLRGADLREANLLMVDLRGADLREANLLEANLLRADLRGADLVEASLEGANLLMADLRGADLREANLLKANLLEANLRGADVRSVKRHVRLNVAGTWRFTDLTFCYGLVQSQVDDMRGDSGTSLPPHIQRPKHWPLLPDKEETPTDERDSEDTTNEQRFVFLSYSHDDTEKASVIERMLTELQIPVWWDKQMLSGDQWRYNISLMVRDCAAVFTLWTDNSTKSRNVREEAALGQSAHKLVHARLDDASLPYGFSETQYADLRNWDGEPNHPEFKKLVQALRDKLNPPSKEELRNRITSNQTTAAVPEGGKVVLHDLPLNTPPPVSNPQDLTQRIEGQKALAESIKSEIEQYGHNVPDTFVRRVERYLVSLSNDPLSWYTLQDAIEAVAYSMKSNDPEGWNEELRFDCETLITRHKQIQPLLQPKQPPQDEEEKPAPVPDPVLDEPAHDEVAEISDDLAEQLNSDEAESTIEENSLAAVKDQNSQLSESLKQAETPGKEEQKAGWLRRNLKRVAGTLAVLITGISAGVAANALTSNEAAQTLLANLEKLLDMLLKLFH